MGAVIPINGWGRAHGCKTSPTFGRPRCGILADFRQTYLIGVSTMGTKILTLIAAAFLLVACSSTSETSPTAGGGVGDGSVAPGSQQDLVVNVGDRVFFELNSYNLTAQGQATLQSQTAWLQEYPDVSLVIEGHADERGTREYNLALGERRAVTVRNYLIASGVDPSRLITVSYGKERPAVVGSNESAWAQNRRGVSVVN